MEANKRAASVDTRGPSDPHRSSQVFGGGSADAGYGERRGRHYARPLGLLLALLPNSAQGIAFVPRFQVLQIVFQVIAEAHEFDSGEILRKCSKE